MFDLRREACGAVLSERCNSLVDLRARGTVTGNPYIVAGPRGGRALLLDGDDDKVSIPCNRSMNSFEAWVYFATITEEVADFDGGTHYIKATAGTLAATGWAAPTIYVDGAAGTTITVGWHHIAATSATAFTCTNLQLGTDNTGFGSVRIADVSLWGRALTAAEVLQEAQGTTWDYNLYEVSHWDMSNINPPDVGFAGNGNNGTGTGLVAATDIVPCPYGGYATEFNGSDEWVSCGTGASLNLTSQITIAALVRNTGAGFDYIAGKSAASYLLWVRDIGKIILSLTLGGTTRVLEGATSILDSKWHTVIGSYDGSFMRLFVDGVQDVAPAAYTGAIATEAAEFRISSSINPRQWTGQIGDVRLCSLGMAGIAAADLHARLTRGRA